MSKTQYKNKFYRAYKDKASKGVRPMLGRVSSIPTEREEAAAAKQREIEASNAQRPLKAEIPRIEKLSDGNYKYDFQGRTYNLTPEEYAGLAPRTSEAGKKAKITPQIEEIRRAKLQLRGILPPALQGQGMMTGAAGEMAVGGRINEEMFQGKTAAEKQFFKSGGPGAFAVGLGMAAEKSIPSGKTLTDEFIGVQQITNVAHSADIIRVAITGKKPTTLSAFESTFGDLTSSIKMEIDQVRKGYGNESQILFNFEKAATTIGMVEEWNKIEGNTNLRYWETQGLEFQGIIDNQKTQLEDLRIELLIAINDAKEARRQQALQEAQLQYQYDLMAGGY